jgi:hypothetical protein
MFTLVNGIRPSIHVLAFRDFAYGSSAAARCDEEPIEIENFSEKTALAVRQDLYAKMLAITLCSTLAFPIEERVTSEYQADKKRNHNQKINRTSAVAMLQQILIPSHIRKKFEQALRGFDDLVIMKLSRIKSTA